MKFLKGNIQKILLSLILILFFIHYSLQTNHIVKEKNYDFNSNLQQTLKWIKINTPKESIILSDWNLGPNIVTYSERGVISTSKVYPSEINFTAKRYIDTAFFFFSKNESSAIKIVKKYNITHILVPKRTFQEATCLYVKACYTDLTFLNNDTGKFIVNRMRDNTSLKNFKLIYSSEYFNIYSVNINQM